jgi:hypothetical protein
VTQFQYDTWNRIEQMEDRLSRVAGIETGNLDRVRR